MILLESGIWRSSLSLGLEYNRTIDRRFTGRDDVQLCLSLSLSSVLIAEFPVWTTEQTHHGPEVNPSIIKR